MRRFLSIGVAAVIVLAAGRVHAGVRTPLPTRTPKIHAERTRIPTKTARPTRTESSQVERTRVPTKTSLPTRTPIAVEGRTPLPTKTSRATRTPVEVVGRTPLPTKTTRPTRTPITLENPTPVERTRIPTKTMRPTRTPISVEEHTPVLRTRVPTKAARPTRTPLQEEQRTPIERTRIPTKTARPTRTPAEVAGRSPLPTKTLRPTRTPLGLTERTEAPTKTARPTRTPIPKDHPTAGARTRPPTKTARPTWTPTPIPQFVRGNINAKCSIQQKGQRTTITMRVDNQSGAAVENVRPNALRVQPDAGTDFSLTSGPSPHSVSRLRDGDTATFTWSGKFVPPGAVAFIGSAAGVDPFGQTFNTALLDCGTIAWGTTSGSEADSAPVITGDPPLDPNPGVPDLTIDARALAESIRFETGNFAPDNCAIAESCVGGTGLRRLLRFDTVTPNIGTGDLFLGDPRSNPSMVWSQCHRHYHFTQYADYRLVDAGGHVVATGHKQAFCLIDLELVDPTLGVDGPKYTCLYQGITKGWADIYDSYLDCQWIDITGVPPGHYFLDVHINPAGVVHELDYSNNEARVPVEINSGNIGN